jgi:hypothetical protein
MSGKYNKNKKATDYSHLVYFKYVHEKASLCTQIIKSEKLNNQKAILEE